MPLSAKLVLSERTSYRIHLMLSSTIGTFKGVSQIRYSLVVILELSGVSEVQYKKVMMIDDGKYQ